MEAKPRAADDAPPRGHRAADNHEQSEAIRRRCEPCEANRTSAMERVKLLLSLMQEVILYEYCRQS